MKEHWGYIAYGMAWLSTSIAVCVAIYITKSAMPLWAMLLPACISLKTSKDDKE